MKHVTFLIAALLLCAGVPAVFAGEIHEAAKSGDIATLKALLDKDPGLLYAKDEVGKTPAHWAVGRGQPEALKLLLDVYKVDVNVRNKNQGTPLHVAASQAQPECARILIAHGADVNARTKNDSTPLHFAAFKGKPGHTEVARILIEHGADVNAKTADTGATPLTYAVMKGNNATAALLKQHGAVFAGRQGQRRDRGGMRRGMQGGGWQTGNAYLDE